MEARIAPIQAQIDQLGRQFWVSKAQVKANAYDLTASRYRQVTPDEAYYEQPEVTLERLSIFERVIGDQSTRAKKRDGTLMDISPSEAGELPPREPGSKRTVWLCIRGTS